MTHLKSLSLTNFRNFDTLTISELTQFHIFTGPNSSGKTSILYSIIMLLHCRNTLREDSRHCGSVVHIDVNETTDLLHFSTRLSNFRDLLVKSGEIESLLKGTFSVNDGSFEMQCRIKNNRSVEINVNNEIEYCFGDKIGFVFVGIPKIVNYSLERAYSPILPKTTTVENIRNVYRSLSDEYKIKIVDHLKFLHVDDIVSSINPNTPLEIFEYGQKNPVELMYVGSALKKIFSAYVLLWNLIETVQSEENIVTKGIFLMEEPDALLCNSIFKPYIHIVQDICMENNIQLFITSNSAIILDLLPDSNIHVLVRNISL